SCSTSTALEDSQGSESAAAAWAAMAGKWVSTHARVPARPARRAAAAIERERGIRLARTNVGAGPVFRRMMEPVLLRVLFPPSLGQAKATARAELVSAALAHELEAQVDIEVAANYGELERRALVPEAHIVWAPSSVCARLEPTARAIFKVV